MADNKTQDFNGKKVAIVQNPINQLWYICEVKDPEEQRVAARTATIGAARDDGFTGDGFKTEADAQHWIDEAPDPRDVKKDDVDEGKGAKGTKATTATTT